MAKRRKVGNLLALAVLSTLIQRPMHPYELASILRARGKEQDMKIKWGSLYTVVQNLEKHGFVVATESLRQGGRPERTIYRITDSGREELTDWVRELLGAPERELMHFEAGLSVMAILSPDETIDLLRQRLHRLTEEIAADRGSIAAASHEVPRLFLIETEYTLAIREAEVTWIGGLLDELSSGTFPGIDDWRAWHTTGEMSAELTELAERGSTTE